MATSRNPKPGLEPAKAKAEWGETQAAALWDNLYARHIPSLDGQVILDLGCSWGYMLKHLLERFNLARAIGVDVGPLWETVEHGWEYETEGDRVEFHCGSLPDIAALVPRSVNYLLCTSVLQYIRPEELLRTLERAYELLKPGGEMVLRTRCFTSYVGADLHPHYDEDYVHLLNPLRDVHLDLRAWKDIQGRYLNYLTATNYLILFQQAGFEILDARRRQNPRSPELVERLKVMFPWVPLEDLLCAELEARLLRPIEAADLPTLEKQQSTLPKG
jgi:SAM-dependent methyltransferase